MYIDIIGPVLGIKRGVGFRGDTFSAVYVADSGSNRLVSMLHKSTEMVFDRFAVVHARGRASFFEKRGSYFTVVQLIEFPEQFTSFHCVSIKPRPFTEIPLIVYPGDGDIWEHYTSALQLALRRAYIPHRYRKPVM